ncbi:MAG: glycosyltransferase family 4 protein [Ilumatobacteraceae bacterium]
MRIVLVVPGGVDPPGAPRTIPFIHHLVERISADHSVTVLAVGHDPHPGEWRLFDADVVNIPIGEHSKRDIVRTVTSATRVASRDGRPDVVHGLWSNLPGLVAGAVGRRHGAPVVVSVGGGEFARVPDIGYGGALHGGTRRLAGAAVRLATIVTVATGWMRAHLEAEGIVADELIPLGADTRIFHPRPGQVTDPRRLVHIGSLNRVKDQDLLVRAMADLFAMGVDAHLTVVGPDTMDGHHARLATEIGVSERITFTGQLAPAQVAEVVRGASWHVLTSRHDAGPVAVLEAAACGVPTVGVRLGHVADFTLPGVPPAAVPIDEHTPVAAARAVAGALSGDDRPAIAGRAERWARTHDADATARAFDVLYRRLAANSSRRAAASSGSDPRRSR